MPARLKALFTVVCTAVLGALLPAALAHAESRTVQGGRLDWGIKSSFQSYVTGPVANGSYSFTGGAATVGSSQFRFPSATGTYDGSTGAFRASFAGGVHFVGHKTTDGGYQLDLTISNPAVRIAGGSGTLYVDVRSKALGTGAVTDSAQVPFANLSLGGIGMKGAGAVVTLNNVPATLTSQGAKSFAGYYTAGTALDPVSLSADVEAAAAVSPTPSASRTTVKPASSATPKPSGAIDDGAVDWGVRRTFREYVTGDIARGKWTLSGGAEDGGALFRFPAGKGTYKESDRSLTADFKGAIRFAGENGLDLRLGGFRAVVKDGEGTLYADVTGADHTGKRVPLVTFTAKDFTPKKGLVQLTEAPAELTAKGAKAFGGTYQAGTDMDPVSLAVALTDDAELPALPDLGTTASATPETTKSPSAPAASPGTENTASGTSDGGVPALPVGLAAGSLLLVAAAYGVFRRRRATDPVPSDGPEATAAGSARPADED